jgi:hypothetical protein
VSTFEKSIAREIKTNPKGFWKYAKSKLKTKSRISDLEMGNSGKRTSSDQEKTEVLNNFFTEVFTKEDTSVIPTIPRKQFVHSLSSVPISRDAIAKKLKSLKISKSPGPDCIHPRLLREQAELLKEPLKIIFCKSLQEGRLPRDWKVGHISPIFKKGNRHLASNYRPVCLTSVCCKIMETFVREELIKHMKENGLFSDEQHGFLGGRSCITQLLETLEEWTKILDEGGCLDAVYMDFMKAFDSVPHKRLLSKLGSYVIQGDIFNWIRAFLEDRSQRVVINGSKSPWSEVTSGIPQGSVLGPILFVIYINDLPETVSCGIKLFADDTKVYRPIKNTHDCEALQSDIDNLEQWSEKWQM